jgi:hypothetical protein
VLAPVKRLKFSREMDYETDDEIVGREAKKCLGDLRTAINRFVKEDPTDLVVNFSENLEKMPGHLPTSPDECNPEHGELANEKLINLE